MTISKIKSCFLGALVAATLIGSSAHAQATRTWVSGVGDDVNPCSRTAPCKTFAGAISKTAAGGEIDVLDPGGFGAVTVTKAITINGPEGYGGILNAGTNGVTINAGVNDVVVLRRIGIQGAGTGVNGIRFLAGAALIVDQCDIAGANAGFGIDFSPAGASVLHVIDSNITNNGTIATTTGGGLIVRPTGGTGSANVTITNSQFTRNTFGIRGEGATAAAAGVKITVTGGSFVSNGFGGVIALTTTASPVAIMLNQSIAANNGTNGLNANGSTASIIFGSSTVTGNTTGLNPQSSGQLISYGNNQVDGNVNNGAPTSTTPLK
ncbi:hypothetical protein [Caulobacter sp. LjRoot300]|uniref:hypothetical protein n=1 Tax=Caulobacter sp. LjRoot300 TaxID=3342321 RepID=UPI003ECDD42E